jgi:hypothetical protein
MPITTIAYHGGAEEVKVLGQPISNSKIAGTLAHTVLCAAGGAAAGKKILCMRICEKRVASFNKTQ